MEDSLYVNGRMYMSDTIKCISQCGCMFVYFLLHIMLLNLYTPQILQLVELKALPPLSNMLTVQDPRTVTVALDGIHNILTAANKVIYMNRDHQFLVIDVMAISFY